MKKLFLFMAAAAFAIVSCNDDDNAAPIVTTGELNGTWVDTIPSTNYYWLAFENNNVSFNRQDGLSRAYTYEVSGSKLIFTSTENTAAKSEHPLEKVNDSIIKVGNLYLAGSAENGTPTTVTFKRASLLD